MTVYCLQMTVNFSEILGVLTTNNKIPGIGAQKKIQECLRYYSCVSKQNVSPQLLFFIHKYFKNCMLYYIYKNEIRPPHNIYIYIRDALYILYGFCYA